MSPEIASSVGIRRQRVGGFVAGQHGDGAVPLWSTLRVRGLDVEERVDLLNGLRGDRDLAVFGQELAAAKADLAQMEAADLIGAFSLIDRWPPDVRTIVRPYLTHHSGAKTANGTAGATVDLVSTVLEGRDVVVAGQVALDGEVDLGGAPWRGVLGVPIALGPDGWTRVLLDEIAPDEEARLVAVGSHINESVAGWTS